MHGFTDGTVVSCQVAKVAFLEGRVMSERSPHTCTTSNLCDTCIRLLHDNIIVGQDSAGFLRAVVSCRWGRKLRGAVRYVVSGRIMVIKVDGGG